MSDSDALDSLERPLILLVVGECGDGKSSLIRHFYDTTPEAIKKEILRCLHPGLPLPDPPKAGDCTAGITKRSTLYPVVIGHRRVLLIDTPGFGDTDIKPEQILAGLVAELESDELNGVLLCSSMANSRLTMGQKFCVDLINAAIDEDSKWDKFVLVGTKKDLHFPGKKNQAEKWKKWRCGMMENINLQCSGALTKSALVCVCPEDSDDDEDDEEGAADIGELVSVVSEFDVLSTMICKKLSDEELVRVMNEALRDTVVTQAALRVCRDSRAVQGAAEVGYTLADTAGFLGTSGFGGALGLVTGYLGYGWALTNVCGVVPVIIDGTAVISLGSGTLAGGFVAATYGAAYIGGLAGAKVYDYCKGGDSNMTASLYDTMTSMLPASHELTPMQSVQMSSSLDVEICGALSLMIYKVASKSELDIALSGHFGKRTEMIEFSEVLYGKDVDVYQPAAVVVHARTMYIAWRGTKTLMDMITDSGCTPTVGPLWQELCPEIKVHTGMYGMMQKYFYEQLAEMQAVVTKHRVRRVIFTGHSLGGGLAQIALLSVLGQRHAKFGGFAPTKPEKTREMYKVFRPVEFSSVVFAAPMAFHLPAPGIKLQFATQQALKFLQQQSVNFVFDDDIVPRFPAHVDFWKEACVLIAADKVSTAASAWYTQTGMDAVKDLDNEGQAVSAVAITATAIIFGAITKEFVKSKARALAAGLSDSVLRMSQYQHTASILHFDFKGKGKIVQASLTPAEFALKSHKFSNSELSQKYLLEYHSVCPSCMGESMKAKQQGQWARLKEKLSTPLKKAEVVYGEGQEEQQENLPSSLTCHSKDKPVYAGIYALAEVESSRFLSADGTSAVLGSTMILDTCKFKLFLQTKGTRVVMGLQSCASGNYLGVNHFGSIAVRGRSLSAWVSQ
jgi:hypothetical protein